jgi:hypothetical protein
MSTRPDGGVAAALGDWGGPAAFLLSLGDCGASAAFFAPRIVSGLLRSVEMPTEDWWSGGGRGGLMRRLEVGFVDGLGHGSFLLRVSPPRSRQGWLEGIRIGKGRCLMEGMPSAGWWRSGDSEMASARCIRTTTLMLWRDTSPARVDGR